MSQKKLCRYCGIELGEDGRCINGHNINKKMCVNCQHVCYTEDGYFCAHEGNMADAKAKMVEAANSVSNGFPFTIEVSPLPLKKPSLKCGNWVLNNELIKEFEESFVQL